MRAGPEPPGRIPGSPRAVAARPDPGRPNAIIAALLLCTACAGANAGEIYRWVDEAGRVHYGDQPPAEGAQRIETDAPADADPDLARRRDRARRLGEILGEDRALRDGERQAAERADADRARQCDTVRERLERAQRATYIYRDTGDPTNPDVISDTERADLETMLQQEVRRLCGAGDR